MRKNTWISFTLVLSLTLTSFAQTPVGQRDQSVKIGTSEVQLDLVVKDKKGRMLRDLKAGDFEVFEDGVKQSVESFRLVTRGVAAEPMTKAEETKAENKTGATTPRVEPTKVTRDADTGVSAVAIVFDRLSQDARKRAHLASLGYVSDAPQQDSYVGVYTINLGINVLQNYTKSTDLVRKAIDRAAVSVSSTFEASGGSITEATNQQRSQLEGIASGAGAAAAGAAGGAAAGNAAGAASVDLMMAEMQARTKETFDILQRDQQGYATTNGLMAVINSMQRLPGRKAIIFFSEGVAIPPNVKRHFSSVINNANRANVSLYTIDIAGLRADSPLAQSRDEINNRSRQRMDSLDRAMNTRGALSAALERNEDILNFNPQNALLQLAEETGGQFIADTNNIGPKLKSVDEDLNTYYLLTYSPTNSNYDGKFRNISVKLNRSGADVQTRKGYYAVNAGSGTPVMYYETSALAALAMGKADNTIPMKSHSFNFPEAAHLGRTAFEVEVPANGFTFSEDKEKKVYGTDFSIVVLVKDENQQIVRKLSTHYTLSGALDQVANAKKGLVLFYREEDLPPGKFVVEAAAHDLPSGKVTIKKSTIEVPEADETKLRLSSVAIVKRAEQLPKGDKGNSPFQIAEVMMYPNLGEPISKAAQKIAFYFTIYPATLSTFTPQLTVELLQSGKALAAVPLKLPTPNESGRIPYVGNLPLESLSPGEYDLRVTVRGDRGSAIRTTKFTVVP
jgi:VWFA-related protein